LIERELVVAGEEEKDDNIEELNKGNAVDDDEDEEGEDVEANEHIVEVKEDEDRADEKRE
jgi:hypothetical protein